MAVKVMKYHYFSILIVSTEFHLATLIRITQSILSEEVLNDHLQNCAEEFVEHLTDKVTWICSQLNP